jgi:hypothetical protein
MRHRPRATYLEGQLGVHFDCVVATELVRNLSATLDLGGLKGDDAGLVRIKPAAFREAFEVEAEVRVADRAGLIVENQRRGAPVTNLDGLYGPSDKLQM